MNEQEARLGQDSVLLPKAQLPDGAEVGDSVEVFVFEDSRGSVVATTARPAVSFGQFACLTVADTNEYGAFVSWGLNKDLLVPLKEQPRRLLRGLKYCVTLTRDAQGRALGSARVEDFFDRDLSSLGQGQAVELLVYEFHDLGAKVVVDQRFGGLIYDDDIYQELEIGTTLRGFVDAVREDGKLDIRLRAVGKAALSEGKDQVLQALDRAGGSLPLNDKSSPDEVYSALRMSKKAFKRAVGMLLKSGQLQLTDSGIRLPSGGEALGAPSLESE